MSKLAFNVRMGTKRSVPKGLRAKRLWRGAGNVVFWVLCGLWASYIIFGGTW